MKSELVNTQRKHVENLLGGSTEDWLRLSSVITVDSLMKAYTSPGSLSATLLVCSIPICAGGIINLGWNRGEAWILASSEARKHFRLVYRSIKTLINKFAHDGNFHRVQVTSFGPEDKLIRLLGFSFEGRLSHYGPCGENASLYSRIF